MKEHEKRGKYVGRASRRVSHEELTLEAAFVDAYERAIASKPEDERGTVDSGPVTFRFRVVAIQVEGTNPIGDYIVHLADD